MFADAEPVLGYQTDLLGDYQQRNINGVVACIHQLKNFEVPEAAISKGLQNVVKNTGLMGRWQVLQQHPLVVCDTAHNKEGLQLVLKQVEKQSFEKLHVVLGFVKDKDVRSVLTLFPKDAHYYFVKPSIPRGMEADQLRELAEEQGLKGKVCKSVNKGLKKALKNLSPHAQSQ